MNFIIALSKNKDYLNIIIITNRLLKDVSLTALSNLEVKTVIQSFIKNVFSFHKASSAIVLNQSSQFISEFWTKFCKTLNIQHQLFTTFHLQINRFTERINSVIKLMLRVFSNWNQTNWTSLLLMVQLVIKNHIASATEISLFFLLHNYELNTIQMKLSQIKKSFNEKSLKFWVDTVMSKMENIMKFAQTVIINTQQEQEH